LAGIGGVINLSVTDTILTLESTDLNTPVEGSLTLHNNGTIEADVSLEITGTQSSKFKIISPEPTFTIVPGGSEVVVIQFIPKSQNDVTAYLEISNQGDSIPRIIELSGKVSPTSVVESASPLTYFKTYPNPANNLINIEFNLDEPMLIELLVYDNTGNFVKNLGIFSAATQGNKIEWNGLDGYGNPISSGSYNIILRTKKMTKSFRVIFVK
ncbi:MAG: T9SS type A sorting domain-containing protein, partial [Bacteroidota bacterium]